MTSYDFGKISKALVEIGFIDDYYQTVVNLMKIILKGDIGYITTRQGQGRMNYTVV